MISIIICSRTEQISKDLEESIKATIGVDYQLIVVVNDHNQYDIFTAYAEGTKQAKGDILCFIHDDVVLKTNNWGKILYDTFSNTEIGLVGIVGTHFFPKCPSAWWEPEIISGHLIQGKYINRLYSTEYVQHDKYKDISSEVVSVDGCFICIPKTLFNTIYWDTKIFKGFHGYDTDICMQVHNAGFKICISWDILVEHKSPGCYNEAFLESQNKIVEKWKEILPLSCGIGLGKSEMESRTRLVELKHALHSSEKNYRLTKESKEFKLGNAILHPWVVIKRRLKLSRNISA